MAFEEHRRRLWYNIVPLQYHFSRNKCTRVSKLYIRIRLTSRRTVIPSMYNRSDHLDTDTSVRSTTASLFTHVYYATTLRSEQVRLRVRPSVVHSALGHGAGWVSGSLIRDPWCDSCSWEYCFVLNFPFPRSLVHSQSRPNIVVAASRSCFPPCEQGLPAIL